MDNNVNESYKLMQFLCEIGKLKHLDRKGWTLPGRDVYRPETVSGIKLASFVLIDDH